MNRTKAAQIRAVAQAVPHFSLEDLIYKVRSLSLNRAKRLILWQVLVLRMAGRQGFEPRYADPESGDKFVSCWFA